GSFTAVDELLEVKGIGKSLLEKNRDRLEVK
ncbi:[weak similarity to] competence protein ComEA helix-hairpin-helix region, partial [methanotrophic bacterial endosymbiont of Bathymodiolus sp.]